MNRYLKILIAVLTWIISISQGNLYHSLELGVAIDSQAKFDLGSFKESSNVEDNSDQEPIRVNWDVLMDIEYKLKHFEEIGMEIYAPDFMKAQKELDGKEVIIEGYVIPFDEDGGSLTLSHFPFAACFFCGNASPASVISMYLRNEKKRYKIDDFKKFRGTLHLNYDDPYEFYYILRDAREI